MTRWATFFSMCTHLTSQVNLLTLLLLTGVQLSGSQALLSRPHETHHERLPPVFIWRPAEERWSALLPPSEFQQMPRTSGPSYATSQKATSTRHDEIISLNDMNNDL